MEKKLILNFECRLWKKLLKNVWTRKDRFLFMNGNKIKHIVNWHIEYMFKARLDIKIILISTITGSATIYTKSSTKFFYTIIQVLTFWPFVISAHPHILLKIIKIVRKFKDLEIFRSIRSKVETALLWYQVFFSIANNRIVWFTKKAIALKLIN